jgi:hypothetical protein
MPDPNTPLPPALRRVLELLADPPTKPDVSKGYLDLLGAQQVEDAAVPKNTSAIEAIFSSPVGSMLYDNALALSRCCSPQCSSRPSGLTSRRAGSPWTSAAVPAASPRRWAALRTRTGSPWASISPSRCRHVRCVPRRYRRLASSGQARNGFPCAGAATACTTGRDRWMPRPWAAIARRDGHHTSWAVSNAGVEDLIHSRKLNVQFRIRR